MILGAQSFTTLLRHVAYGLFPSWFMRSEDLNRGTPIGNVFYYLFVEGGYFHIQATKPDTVGEMDS